MLKHVLLASAFAISAPAFAQDTPAQETTPPAGAQTPPADATEPAPAQDMTTPVDEAEPATQAEPATPAQPAQPGDAPATAAEPATPAQPEATKPDATAQAQKPASPEQIAQIVDKDFATYDKDSDGSLKTEEFGAWMVALRSASEPAFTGQSAADKDWISKALAMADKDKSGGVSNAELKGFLAPTSAS